MNLMNIKKMEKDITGHYQSNMKQRKPKFHELVEKYGFEFMLGFYVVIYFLYLFYQLLSCLWL